MNISCSQNAVGSPPHVSTLAVLATCIKRTGRSASVSTMAVQEICAAQLLHTPWSSPKCAGARGCLRLEHSGTATRKSWCWVPPKLPQNRVHT